MRTAVKQVAAWGTAGAVLAALLAAPAAARDSRAAAAGRWIPSFSLVGGVAVQQYDASLSSACADGGEGLGFLNNFDTGEAMAPCIGVGPLRDANGDLILVASGSERGKRILDGRQPSIDPTTSPFTLENRGGGLWGIGGPGVLRPPNDDVKLGVAPFVAGNFQLLSPVITPIPGGPRLFVSGEVQFLFPPSYDVAKEGDGSGLEVPKRLNNVTNKLEPFPEVTPASSIGGAGSKTTAEVQMIGWGAKVGLAFPFRAFGRTLWVKPGAAWTQYQIAVEGLVLAALKDDCCTTPADLGDPQTAGGFGANLREINLHADTTKIFNGIGPSLEFEMDVGRFGPLGVSLFLGGAMYRILGNRTVDLSDTISTDILALSFFVVSLPADTLTANWSFEVDPWMYRAGVGLRFHWLGN